MEKKSSHAFGDKRLEKGFLGLLSSMQSRHSVVLSQLGQTDAEEAQFGRFINNPKVTSDRLLEHYWSSTVTDFSKKNILVISDTSTMSYQVRRNLEQLGPLAGTKTKEGFDLHPSILVDADRGSCYGLGGIDFSQDPRAQTEGEIVGKLERRKNAWKLPLEKKESYKWVSSPQKAVTNCSGAASYTMIGDRESDTYEVIDTTVKRGWGFVYRSKQNRKLAKGQGADTLYEWLEKQEAKHEYVVELGNTPARSAHQARLKLKFGQLTIQRPKNTANKNLPDQLTLYVVEAKESPQTVVGAEQPIHWILLSSHPVETPQDACRILKWYMWRWIIEQCFRTLKLKGLDIESAQVRTYHGLKNMATIALIAALQVMQLVQARDGNTDEQMEQVFLPGEQQCLIALNDKLNGKTEKSKNPHPPESIAFASWVIARLGGWKGYQNRKPPGPITMIDGLTRFYNILEGYYLIS